MLCCTAPDVAAVRAVVDAAAAEAIVVDPGNADGHLAAAAAAPAAAGGLWCDLDGVLGAFKCCGYEGGGRHTRRCA